MKKLHSIALMIIGLCGLNNTIAVAAEATRDATIIWLGKTNLPTGPLVIFCLTNSTAVHFACVPQAIEFSGTNGWTAKPLTGKASSLMRKWTGVPEELLPGQSATFRVPPPSTNVAWRLVFVCQEQKTLVDPVKDTVRQLTDTNAAQHQVRQFSGRKYFLRTPEVKP